MASRNLYRISTEHLNKPGVEAIVEKHFDGFSIIEQIGYWKGIKENSLVIEIQGDSDPEESRKIEEICFGIKELNHQESVLLQVVPSEVYFI